MSHTRWIWRIFRPPNVFKESPNHAVKLRPFGRESHSGRSALNRAQECIETHSINDEERSGFRIADFVGLEGTAFVKTEFRDIQAIELTSKVTY